MANPSVFRSDDLPHRNLRTTRDDPEPRLTDLLDDPTLQTLMRRDGIERAELEALIRRVRWKLAISDRRRVTDEIAQFEASLFVECTA